MKNPYKFEKTKKDSGVNPSIHPMFTISHEPQHSLPNNPNADIASLPFGQNGKMNQ